MKKVFFTILVILSCIAHSQTNTHAAIWFTDFTAAKQEAKTSQRPLIMYLTGSDWCSPCKRLKKDFFENDLFIEKSKKVVLLKIDLPFREDIITPEQRIKNQEINKKYNPKKTFPLLIGFNSKGKEVNRLAAYSGEDTRYHFEFLDKMLRL